MRRLICISIVFLVCASPCGCADDPIVSKGYILGALHPTYSTRSGASSNEALPPDEKVSSDGNLKDQLEKKKVIKGAAEVKKKMESEIEEYVVEHEISEPHARAAAKALRPEQLSTQAVGCQECTRKEMDYCAGSKVMSDHCCCNKKYSEVFPYVPHTCYLGTTRCRTVVQDCSEYARLRACCCDAYLAVKWKAILASAGTNHEPSGRYWLLPWIAMTALSLTPLVLSN